MQLYESLLSNDAGWALSEGSRHFEGKSAVQTALRRVAQRLEQMGAAFPELDLRVVHAQSATALVKDLPAQTLLVLGAPGGSWLQRQLFGPGHRLQVAAPGGSIVVRHAPRRCFHAMTSPSGHVAGPHLSVADAAHLFTSPRRDC